MYTSILSYLIFMGCSQMQTAATSQVSAPTESIAESRTIAAKSKASPTFLVRCTDSDKNILEMQYTNYEVTLMKDYRKYRSGNAFGCSPAGDMNGEMMGSKRDAGCGFEYKKISQWESTAQSLSIYDYSEAVLRTSGEYTEAHKNIKYPAKFTFKKGSGTSEWITKEIPMNCVLTTIK